MNEEIVKCNKERILIAEIYKEDNMFIEYSNNNDWSIYELFGFLYAIMKKLKDDLIDSIREVD